MNVFFQNVNFSSSSGPNSFGQQLARQFFLTGHSVLNDHDIQTSGIDPDAQLSFIMTSMRCAPRVVLRLDGIYFNTMQDYRAQNAPLLASYKHADAVVVQSNFNRELITRYFGTHNEIHVVHNGSSLTEIENTQPADAPVLDDFDNIWCCASSWRPHKRLAENIRYFLQHAATNDCLLVAGKPPDTDFISHPRVFYCGDVDRSTLLSLYKRSKYFLHLAFLDHCPNVVVDARLAGCQVICASSGGTQEIAGPDAIIIEDASWDWQPLELYKPPRLDFSKRVEQTHSASLDIADVAKKYIDILA